MILVVEAESRNRELLQGALEKMGHSVLAVANEIEAHAIDLEGTGIRAAVIDLAGLSAEVWGLCRFITAQRVPCLVILPRENRQARAMALASGAQTVLVKPLVMKEFLGIIGSLVERP